MNDPEQLYTANLFQVSNFFHGPIHLLEQFCSKKKLKIDKTTNHNFDRFDNDMFQESQD